MEPQKYIDRAKKVFGPIAETIGKEVLEEVGTDKFEEEYIKRLSKITGNPKLVENILKGE